MGWLNHSYGEDCPECKSLLFQCNPYIIAFVKHLKKKYDTIHVEKMCPSGNRAFLYQIDLDGNDRISPTFLKMVGDYVKKMKTCVRWSGMDNPTEFYLEFSRKKKK